MASPSDARHPRSRAIPPRAFAGDYGRNPPPRSLENGCVVDSNGRGLVWLAAYQKTLAIAESTLGTPVHAPRQNVQSTAELRYCRSVERERWTHRPHIYEWPWSATENVPRSPGCWATSIRNCPTPRFHSAAVFARLPPVDLHAC